MRVVLLLAVASCLWAQNPTQRLTSRLAEEAAAFERLAPQVLGEETLVQRAEKPPGRFRIRIGADAKNPPPAEYQQRTLVSEYAFTIFQDDGAMHEIRSVLSVDGRAVLKDSTRDLAAIITARDDGRKRALLRQFEEHGLQGAATDLGQYILLFSPARIDQFEFRQPRATTLNGERVLVFAYSQLDGPGRLTVVDARKNEARNFRLEGEVWVRERDYVPLRITMRGTQTLGENGIAQSAEIDYAMSPYGALLPTAVRHRDMRGNRMVAENNFTYAKFKRFGASSELIFEARPEEARPEARE